MSEPLLFWGFALLAAAFVVMLLEVFVPSGGFLGIIAGGLAIGALVCFWRVSTTWGLSTTIAVLVLTPALIAFALQVWPDTPTGRLLILSDTEEDLARRAMGRTDERSRLESLLGVEGEALTDLRPVGMVRIEGERLEAQSETGMIDAGSRVKVTAVNGPWIRVRAVV